MCSARSPRSLFAVLMLSPHTRRRTRSSTRWCDRPSSTEPPGQSWPLAAESWRSWPSPSPTERSSRLTHWSTQSDSRPSARGSEAHKDASSARMRAESGGELGGVKVQVTDAKDAADVNGLTIREAVSSRACRSDVSTDPCHAPTPFRRDLT